MLSQQCSTCGCLEHNNKMYVHVCFTDYEMANAKIHWQKLIEILRNIGIEWRNRKLIWNLYKDQAAYVKIGEGHTRTCKPQPFLANTSRFSAKPSPADSHWLSRRKMCKPSPAERPVSHWRSTKFQA